MLTRRVLFCCCVLSLALIRSVGATFDDRDELLRKMDGRAEHYGQLSRKIWEFAEVGYKEKQSAELLRAELRAAGFQLQENVADIPTAFVASYGSGKPVIGILGEYDALPGLSQDSVPEKKARVGFIVEAFSPRCLKRLRWWRKKRWKRRSGTARSLATI